MKTWWKLAVPALLVLLALLWLRSRLGMAVLVEPATTGTAVNAVTGTIEVLANIDLSVKAENRGTLTRNVVNPGDTVAAGDLVAEQDSAQLDLQIEQVRIRLEAARDRSGLESTHRIDLESLDGQIKALQLAVDLRQAPASRLEDLQRERRKKEVMYQLDEIQARENLRLLENQLAQLQLQLDLMTTEAPFAGTIATVNAFQGDIVNAGQTLVRLVSHGRYVLMELTEEDYFGVRDGQQVTLRLASYPDRTFSGTVTRLEDVANASSKTRNVIVNVDAPDDVLVPGLSGEGYLVKDERPTAVLIPRRALIGNLVYVVSGGEIEVRRVKPGFLSLNMAEILEGVAEGELVVLEDQNLLKPGDNVKAVRAGER